MSTQAKFYAFGISAGFFVASFVGYLIPPPVPFGGFVVLSAIATVVFGLLTVGHYEK